MGQNLTGLYSQEFFGSPKLVTWAAQEGRAEDLVYHLGQTGPDGLKPAPGVEKRRSPLILASIGGHTKCISILYDAGAKLNERDTDGFTALHHAAANGHLYAVQLLLDLGVNPQLSSRFGITPIHLATSSGHVPMLSLLASHNVNINAQESWGQTPLIIATQQSRLECMKTLLHLNADTEIHDHHHGNTALHVACTTKDEETVLLLLDGGANVHSVNKMGLSSLGVAIENKFYRCVQLLIEYGATMNEKDREISSSGLQEYIQECTSTPLPLSRLSRVAIRQAIGPVNLEYVLSNWPSSVSEYIQSIRNDCCETEVAKKYALVGRTIIRPTNKIDEATTKF